jgi:hypothetical protein
MLEGEDRCGIAGPVRLELRALAVGLWFGSERWGGVGERDSRILLCGRGESSVM